MANNQLSMNLLLLYINSCTNPN